MLSTLTVEGQTGKNLDAMALSLIRSRGCEPAFLDYRPDGRELSDRFPATLCVSINNEVIHGIPDDRKFQFGDVVSLDLGLKQLQGVCKCDVSDTRCSCGDKATHYEYDDGATTVIVGHRAGSAVARRLVAATREALDEGCAAAKPGNRIFDISRAIKAVADREKFAIIYGYGGHGIGSQLHMKPFIPNEPFGEDGELAAGQRIAIEPMFSTTKPWTTIAANKWTVKVVGGGLAAHFERTITI
jgi:methionyl aminopeptidase